MSEFKEPELTIAVLDFKKPEETRICLESIKRHVKVDHKTIYYHNGQENYPYDFFRDGLCDVFMQSQKNEGLGIGTRDLFRAISSPYTLYLQNDQFIARDFNQEEFSLLKKFLEGNRDNKSIASISLSGPVCGENIYSERCHIIKTATYRSLEDSGFLGYHGAGPYHNGPWREEQIQNIYERLNLLHLTAWSPLVVDNGKYGVRDMGAGGFWVHRCDTKKLWCIRKPDKLNEKYPKFSEKDLEIANNWPDGKIPELEIKHSFTVWPEDQDADYVSKLRSSQL